MQLIRHAATAALCVIASVNAAEAAITGNDLYTFTSGFSSGEQQATNGQVIGSSNGTQAALYGSTNNPGTPVNLQPAVGFQSTFAYSTDGASQVGAGTTPAGSRALLWAGSNSVNSVVNLHPASGYSQSVALGVRGARQAGRGTFEASGFDHALLWSGTSASVLDLHPAGYRASAAYSTNAYRQVGTVNLDEFGGPLHAALWTGTAESFVDLHPQSGYYFSQAVGTSDNQQVGFGGTTTDFRNHALVWNNDAASARDLHPAGFRDSYARGTDGTYQVGYGLTNDFANPQNQALLWTGSADSVVNLHNLLPGTFTQSYAHSITGTTVWGVAYDQAGAAHAVSWTNVPEPTSLSLLAGLTTLALCRRR